MNFSEKCRMVKASVSARQAAEALGLAPDRHGWCRCVWHTDGKPSLKVYDGTKGCYCFSCHCGGDVLDMIAQATGTSVAEAVKWADSAFGLGLTDTSPDRQKAIRRAREAAEKRKAEERVRERYNDRVFENDLDVLTLTLMADEVMEATRPRRYSDGFSDAFCAALQAREDLRVLHGELAAMRMEAKG